MTKEVKNPLHEKALAFDEITEGLVITIVRGNQRMHNWIVGATVLEKSVTNNSVTLHLVDGQIVIENAGDMGLIPYNQGIWNNVCFTITAMEDYNMLDLPEPYNFIAFTCYLTCRDELQDCESCREDGEIIEE